MMGTKDILINSLIITQTGIRHLENLRPMADFVSKGGKFLNPPLVVIVRYDDHQLYVHDGHHRLLAMFCGGRDVVFKEEYEFVEGRFDKCSAVLWDKGFVTPFDPRTEMRISDFRPFKSRALELYHQGKENEAMQYIQTNRHLYMTSRNMRRISEMAESLKLARLPLSPPPNPPANPPTAEFGPF